MNKFYMEYLMKLNGYTYDTFSKDINVSKVQLLRKATGESDFKLGEIRRIKETLNLSEEDLIKIFFEDIVN